MAGEIYFCDFEPFLCVEGCQGLADGSRQRFTGEISGGCKRRGFEAGLVSPTRGGTLGEGLPAGDEETGFLVEKQV